MNRTIIDLSYELTDTMLVYPKNRRPVMEWLGRDNSEGYNLTYLQMIVHTGTHVDSPLHFIGDGETIDAIPLDRLYGKTRLFSFKNPPKSQEIKIADIMDDPDKLEESSIFVLRTGIEDFAEQSSYNYLYPVPSKELIELLIKKNIKAYMTDATSIDPVGVEVSENHLSILGAGIPIVENLCNLASLADYGSFDISALPLRLVGREGSPCRAIAIVEH
ncbi:MAG TPA: hypothetical protein DEZ27_08070 [Sphaerochaeta sp.]|nr:hypothetical protein [Sphaerochaeta sp.]